MLKMRNIRRRQVRSPQRCRRPLYAAGILMHSGMDTGGGGNAIGAVRGNELVHVRNGQASMWKVPISPTLVQVAHPAPWQVARPCWWSLETAVGGRNRGSLKGVAS